MPTPQEIFDQIYNKLFQQLTAQDTVLVTKEFRELAQNVVPAEVGQLVVTGLPANPTVQQLLTELARFIIQERRRLFLNARVQAELEEILRQLSQR